MADDMGTRTVGRRRRASGGIVAAAPLLDLVIALRRDKPFVPKGIHRFRSFEDSAAWTLRMVTRRTPDRRV